MNRALRRKREREDAHAALADARRDLEALNDEKNELLAILNALLIREGGEVVIPMRVLEPARPRLVDADVLPPEPEVAGSEARMRLRLRGYEPPDKSAVERAKERGLWLPGQEDA